MYSETTGSRPRLRTIRQIAKDGIMTEHALRQGIKQGTIPVFFSGTRAYINEAVLLEILNRKPDASAGPHD